VDNCFRALLTAVLEQYCKTKDLRLYNFWHAATHLLVSLTAFKELTCKNLEDHVCGNALGEEFVEFSSDCSELLWALFGNDVLGYLFCVRFILRTGNVALRTQLGVLQLDSLEHHDSSAQVAARLVAYVVVQFHRQVKVLSA